MLCSVPETLDQIATRYGTDKASWYHGYCDDYDAVFTPLRDQPIVLLELGFFEGRSALTWREYFPNATIAVVDINWPIRRVDGVHKYRGDQADPALVATMVAAHGAFDIVIDDASHLEAKTLASFALLWPHVKPGGYYVVEDIDAYLTVPGWQNLQPAALERPDLEMVIWRNDMLVARKAKGSV